MERGPESLNYSQIERLLGDLHDYIPLLNNNEENIDQLPLRNILTDLYNKYGELDIIKVHTDLPDDVVQHNLNKEKFNNLIEENENLNSQGRNSLDIKSDDIDNDDNYQGEIFESYKLSNNNLYIEENNIPLNNSSEEELNNTAYNLREINVTVAYLESNIQTSEIKVEGLNIETPSRWTFVSNGLMVTADASLISTQIKIAEKEIFVDTGETIARIDFMPNVRVSFHRNMLSESIEKGVKGLMSLIEEMVNSTDKIDKPKVIVGNSNLRMAMMAERLGFEIINAERYFYVNEEGRRVLREGISLYDRYVQIIGTMESIEAKSERIKKLNEKIAERNERRAGGNWNPLGTTAYLH